MFSTGWKLLGQLISNIRADRAGGLAAEIAFYAALSIFPAMIALGALLASLDEITGGGTAEAAQEAILAYIGDVLSSERTGTVEATKDAFETGESVVGIAIITAILASSRGFTAIIGALDIAYRVEETRSWFGTRATAVGLSVGSLIVGAFALASIVVSPFFGAGEALAELLGLGQQFTAAWNLAQPAVTFVVVMMWAAAIYYLAPNHQTPFKWDLPGAFVATLWWLAASLGFGYYIQFASQSDNALYGLLGGGLSLLVLFWVLGLGLIVGAEINGVFIVHRQADVQPGSKLGRLGRGQLDRLGLTDPRGVPVVEGPDGDEGVGPPYGGDGNREQAGSERRSVDEIGVGGH